MVGMSHPPVQLQASAEDPGEDHSSISFQLSQRSTVSSIDHTDSSSRRGSSQSIVFMGAPQPAAKLPPTSQQNNDAWAAVPDLLTAQNALSRLLLRRIKELQQATGWPLQGSRRSPAELARLLDKAEEQGSEGAAWQALGMHCSPFLDVPTLPPLLRRDLWGPLDMLLALAGHISMGDDSDEPSPAVPVPATSPTSLPNYAPSSQRTAAGGAGKPSLSPMAFPSLLNNQGGATAGGYAGAGGAVGLPHSLSTLSMMPALQQVVPAGLDWLRGFMADMRPHHRHVGVDDRLQPWFREVKIQAAQALMQEGSPPLAAAYCKYGVPQGCRPGIWQLALGLTSEPLRKADLVEFESLVHAACCQSVLADLWVEADTEVVRDSEHFFLFEEILRAVMLAFIRDPQVSARCSVTHCPGVVIEGSGSGGGRPRAFPPLGILLPQGSVMLAGPLCFLYDEPAAVYCMHKALYCRYWCKLHSLNPASLPSPALPVLIKTYEALIQELDPEVVLHLSRLGVPPASLAIPWISRAFVGYLPVQEVLLLWDRVIGLDSLLPLPVLAAAVVCFRRQVLLSCGAAREVLEAMADLSQLQTVPLLQAVLFQG